MSVTTQSLANRAAIGAGLLLIGFILGLAAGRDCSKPDEIRLGSRIATSRARPDSTKVGLSIQLPPIQVNAHAKLKLATRRRTTTNRKDSSSTVSCFDTILRRIHEDAGGDTINVCHIMPQDSFSLSIKFAPRDTTTVVHYIAHDALISERDTIIQRIHSDESWYAEPLKLLGAILTGFLIGGLRK